MQFIRRLDHFLCIYLCRVAQKLFSMTKERGMKRNLDGDVPARQNVTVKMPPCYFTCTSLIEEPWRSSLWLVVRAQGYTNTTAAKEHNEWHSMLFFSLSRAFFPPTVMRLFPHPQFSFCPGTVCPDREVAAAFLSKLYFWIVAYLHCFVFVFPFIQ